MSSKKASKAPEAEAKYQIRDVVLAKVRGYPPWPAMIVDPEKVSKSVKKEKPISKKTTFYCVRFFPAGDHTWAVAKDLSRLQQHEIEAYINEPSKKNGDLKRGYEIALNPSPWEEELEAKQAELEAAGEEEEEGVDQLDESEGGEDEVDEDDEGGGKKKKAAGKKRKRENVSAEELKKKRKSNQEALSAKRRPIAGKKGAKGKKGSTENVESEDGERGDDDGDAGGKKSKKGGRAKDGDERQAKRGKKDKEEAEDPEDALLANDPEAQRVKEWRHKLQRAFLTPKTPPKPDAMAGYDQIFQAVEAYDKLTIDYLQYSKIGKVMRRIAGMDQIPRDGEFHFKDRASKLVAAWQAIIQKAEAEASGQANGANTTASEGAGPSGSAKSPRVNGDVSHDAEMANGDAKTQSQGDTVKDVDATSDNSKEKKDEEAMDMSDS